MIVMTVELTPTQARIVREELLRGRFATPSDVIERALAAWTNQDRQTELRLRALPDINERLSLLEQRVRLLEMKQFQ